uniref:Reverse transcriptase zinc-binding domain-containing protein n=1 Tax=Chenopodium quinoa TaxID=63459 RepID=A0A803N152_CHEQI
MWKLAANGISVNRNLLVRGMHNDGICGYCGDVLEDTSHLFLNCLIARYGITMDGVRNDRTKKIVATLWSLWMTGNKRTFDGHNVYLTTFLSNITVALQFLRDYLKPDVRKLGTLRVSKMDLQVPSEFLQVSLGEEIHSMVHMNNPSIPVIRVDGSWHKRSSSYGTGWTLFSCDQDEKDAGGNSRLANSALHAETIARLSALKGSSRSGL